MSVSRKAVICLYASGWRVRMASTTSGDSAASCATLETVFSASSYPYLLIK